MLTRKQLLDGCERHKYLLVTHKFLGVVGLNTRFGKKRLLKIGEPDKPTDVVKFVPCSFAEYLRNKLPFIT